MTQEFFIEKRSTLYHLSSGDAWADIRKHGLFCTSDILKQCGIETEQERNAFYRERRKSNKTCTIRGKCTIVVRDQKPLCWDGLRKAVEPELTPHQWIDELNARTFFWTRPKDVNRPTDAASYNGTLQTLIEFSTQRLMSRYGCKAALTTFNVGYTLREPKRRDLRSFQSIDGFSGPLGDIRELTILGSIPDAAKYVTRVTKLCGNGKKVVLFSENDLSREMKTLH